MTQFPQFPMPKHYPNFPSAAQVKEYLQDFVDHFELRQHIELNCLVQYVRPIHRNLWEVTFKTGELRIYKGVLLCNGHHWCPRLPAFEGSFHGKIIHAKEYKSPEQLRGQRVLIIGGGNSACDIAAEAARVAETSTISMRDSVWFLPKSFAGLPLNNLTHWWVPSAIQRVLAHLIIKITFGQHQRYGLRKPNHRLFDKHPTLNNEVPYYIQHGRITPRPAVKRLDGWDVEFVDGSRDRFDLIICATGYQLAYPFLPMELQRTQAATMQCYGGAFLEDYKGIYYIGWEQPHSVGVGYYIGSCSSFFSQLLKLQDEIDVPLGLVLKQLGQPLPTSHLSHGQKVVAQSKIFQLLYPWLAKKARKIDAANPDFANCPLDPQSELNPSLTVF
jgi:Flavin-binding monooxygenase-like